MVMSRWQWLVVVAGAAVGACTGHGGAARRADGAPTDASPPLDGPLWLDEPSVTDASTMPDGSAPVDNGSADALSDANDLIWSSDFETRDLSEWTSVQACPGGVTVVTSPVRRGNYSARFSVADDDTHAKCSGVPTDDPRAQIVGPWGLFNPGDDVYVGFSTFFPADFPTIDAWLMFQEEYGPPFNGSPTVELDVFGDRLGMWSQQNGVETKIWLATQDIHKGTAWEDIALHIKWSTNPSVGFAEIWHNGVRQTFMDGQPRNYFATFVPSINGLLDTVYMNQYRKAGVSLGTVVLYHDDIRVGWTYASVAR
jgi:hypothetical protein